jgi:acetylglutamate kinase
LNIQVVKVGGQELEDATFLADLVKFVSQLAAPVVLVHGAGRDISSLAEKLGLPAKFLAGMRVTCPETLRIVQMVLAGSANVRLVANLNRAGIPALGCTGVDLGMLEAELLTSELGDLGLVGKVKAVHTDFLREGCLAGRVSVLAPLGLSDNLGVLNINADLAAQALAIALDAECLWFLTAVNGIQHNGQRIAYLSAEEGAELVRCGIVTDGMVPKLQAGFAALTAGVSKVWIGRPQRPDEGTRLELRHACLL